MRELLKNVNIIMCNAVFSPYRCLRVEMIWKSLPDGHFGMVFVVKLENFM